MGADLLVIQLISTIVATYGAYKIAKMRLRPEITIPVCREQLNNVYLPMFRLIEKDLYKQIDKETALAYVTELKKIIDLHYELINPNIIEKVNVMAELIEKDCDHNGVFYSLSSKISTAFDSTRKKLGLPTRSFFYKLRNYQVDPVISETLDKTLNFIVFLCAILALLALINMAVMLLTDVWIFLTKIWTYVLSFLSL